MLDFEIQRCTRRCAKTARELQPGETFYSVLVAEGADVVRRDYCQEAWEGPPDGALGWWKSQVPEPSARKANWAPNDVLLDYFQRLDGQAGKDDVRYVLALLMVRRRIVRLEETETDDAGGETLVLFCPRDEMEHRVPVVMPDEQRAREIQEELSKLLYADGK
jgi:hypothetical protein